jgi:hypothetical protein
VSGNRLAIIAALDALEAGDQDLVVEILLDALEEDGAAAPGAQTYSCPECRVDYEWPGLLERHRILFHSLPEAA